MLLLQIYLFSGLVLHKVIWEVLRLRSDLPTKAATGSARLTVVKLVKITIFIGILIQIWLPDFLPISIDASVIRPTGIALFTLGLMTAIAARIQLGNNWSNIESAKVLADHAVVDKGIYGYVRHPIYTGDLLLLIGLELALNSWFVIGALALCPVVMWKAIKEEKMLLRKLTGYVEYHQRTKRFIPFLI
jgi:protein-S-isoprenylcysteine O-methyltransferase Ste14